MNMEESDSVKKKTVGRFEKLCGCSFHKDNSSKLINVTKHKKGLNETRLLIEQGSLSRRSKYVCQQCIESVSLVNSREQADDKDGDDDAKLAHLTEKGTSDHLLATVIEAAKILREIIVNDSKSLYKERPCRSMDSVKEYDTRKWLEDRPKELVTFLSVLLDLNPLKESESATVNRCIEQLYSTQNKFLVLPLSFGKNLLTYTLSGSKLLVTYNGSTMAAGSYSFLTKWLTEQAKDEIRVPDGVVRCVFDNEQVIGKRYTVKANQNTVPSSVVTSHITLSVDEHSEIQKDESLKPKNWLFDNGIDLLQKIENLISEHNEYFRNSRRTLLQNRLRYVMENQKVSADGCYEDDVDELIRKRSERLNEKICVDCGASNDPTYRLCTNCRGKLRKQSLDLDDLTQSHLEASEQEKYDPYSHFRTKNMCKEMNVKVGEPDLISPSGFENIALLLQKLEERAGIKCHEKESNREWLYLENDGAIYTVISKLISNVFTCEACNQSIYGMSNFNSHAKLNFDSYAKSAIMGTAYKHDAIYTTEEECDFHSKIENQTIPEIKKRYFGMLNCIDLPHRNFLLDIYKKDVNNKTKSSHIEFFYRVKEEYELCTALEAI